MTPTSDERREVAERLRENASCSESSPRDVVESYLGIEYDGADVLEESYTSESLLHIADLIDPTCRNGYSSLNDRSFLCSKCGYEAFTYGDSYCDPDDFAFCPNCGARVTDGSDA